MSIASRLREIAAALRGARFPPPPERSATEFGGPTGEQRLYTSWFRTAERNRRRAEADRAAAQANRPADDA